MVSMFGLTVKPPTEEERHSGVYSIRNSKTDQVSIAHRTPHQNFQGEQTGAGETEQGSVID